VPRRSGEKAVMAAKQESSIRWRLLVRNYEFQKDLRIARRQYLEGNYGPSNALRGKWCVDLPNEIFRNYKE
jgi:hypothetical protein